MRRDTVTMYLKPEVIFGRALSALVIAALSFDGLLNILAPEKLAGEMSAVGFSQHLSRPLGWIVLICALVYAVPPTSLIGAILISGFSGGAIAMHFRVGELGSAAQLIALLISVLAWTALAMRRPSLRKLFIPYSRARLAE
jgi:hypothetical protein